jgi:hypothetical protein
MSRFDVGKEIMHWQASCTCYYVHKSTWSQLHEREHKQDRHESRCHSHTHLPNLRELLMEIPKIALSRDAQVVSDLSISSIYSEEQGTLPAKTLQARSPPEFTGTRAHKLEQP